VLPIFYDAAKGHNHALYLALLGEARYFQIHRLQEWLEDKQYFDVVKVQRSAEKLDVGFLSETLPTYVDVEYYPAWGTKKVYVCPRGIYMHRGRPEACGKNCMKVQGDADTIYEEEPVLRALMVKKEVIFDRQACLVGPHQLVEPDMDALSNLAASTLSTKVRFEQLSSARLIQRYSISYTWRKGLYQR
jgi:hypothetical protein